MSQTPPWYLQYPEVKYRRNWRSWPLIRQLRSLQWRRLRPLAAGRQEELSVIRYYWADFLESRRPDLRGRGLEIGETATLRHYGGPALTQADAIDLTPTALQSASSPTWHAPMACPASSTTAS